MFSINTDERLITMRMALMGLLSSNRVHDSYDSAAREAKEYADALLQVHRETSNNVESAPSAASNKASPCASQIADSIEAACFPVKGEFILPRESWLREWCRQLRALQ